MAGGVTASVVPLQCRESITPKAKRTEKGGGLTGLKTEQNVASRLESDMPKTSPKNALGSEITMLERAVKGKPADAGEDRKSQK